MFHIILIHNEIGCKLMLTLKIYSKHLFFYAFFLLYSFTTLTAAANSLYEDLELSPEASSTQIARAYRRLAIRYHPDRNPDNEKAKAQFKRVQNAYDILSDPQKKEFYDKGPENINWADYSSAERPESSLHDPFGIQDMNHERINFLFIKYAELRKSMSPVDAVIKTMKIERKRKIIRSSINWWGKGYADSIYESQTRHVFGEFIDEVINDIFYTGENIDRPQELPLLNLSNSEAMALTIASKNALSFSRLPTVKKIMEIQRLVGSHGNYNLATRAIREAQSTEDLNHYFYFVMKNMMSDTFQYEDTLEFGDNYLIKNETNLRRTRKRLVHILISAIERIHPGDSVSDYIYDFIETHLSKFKISDRFMIQNLIELIDDIGTKESAAAIEKMIVTSRSRFVRKRALISSKKQKISLDSLENQVTQADNTTPKSTKINKDNLSVRELKRVLSESTPSAHRSFDLSAAIKLIDEQFEAAAKLYELEQLDEEDFKNVESAVYKYYWRYRGRGTGESDRVIHMLLELAPENPKAAILLARASEDGWGYSTERMAEMAINYQLQSPELLEAFRRFLESSITSRFEHTKTIEALGRLANKNDKAVIKTLKKTAAFKYLNREAGPPAYEAAMALARIGDDSHDTINFLKKLMRENEDYMIGSGVPFAAALIWMKVQDEVAESILRREITYNPNGQRNHYTIAKEALSRAELSIHNITDLSCSGSFEATNTRN